MRPASKWPLANVLREALLAIRARPIRALVTMLTLGLAFGALSSIEIRETTSAIERSELLRDAGQFVFRVRTSPFTIEPQIDRALCDRLSVLDQVVASGGLSDTQSIEFPAAPGTPFRSYEGTSSAVRVLDASASGAANHVWLSTGARRTLGATGEVRLPSGLVGTAGTFEPGRRHPSAGSMVVVPASSELVGECWFSTHPAATEATLRAVEAQLMTDELLVVAGSIIEDSDLLLDPAGEFDARASRRLWIAAGLFGGVLLAILAFVDRGDMALYRLLGASRSDAVAVGFVGSLLQIAWAMFFALAAAAFWARDMPPEGITNAVYAVCGAASLVILVGLAARLLATTGSVGRELRQRN